MEWSWPALAVLVKTVLALGPFFIREEEFNLGGANWLEAKDAISVFACRCILATVPATLALQTFERTGDKAICGGRGVAPFVSVIVVVLVGLSILGIRNLPHVWLRGVLRPAIVTVLMIIFETGYGKLLLDPAAKAMCQPVTKTSTSPEQPQSQRSEQLSDGA